VQELLAPPATVLGLHTRDDTPGCVTLAVVKPREKFLEFPLKLAVSIAEPLTLTADGALAVNPMLLAPDAMVTDCGTVTDELLLLSETMVELVTAAVRLTMHDVVAGGVKLEEEQVRLDSVAVAAALFKAIVKFLEVPFRPAVSRAELFALTADGALAVNPALLAPAKTVTDGGTLNDALLLVSATLVELVAAAVRLTVHDAVAGGVKLEVEQVRLESVGVAVALFKVNVKFLEVLFRLAVTRAELFALTADGALAVKTALLAPAKTVTDGGTLSDALPLVSATLFEVAAAALKFTVQDDVAGGVKLDGVHVRLDTDTVDTGWLMVMVVPVPVALIPAPLASDAERPERETGDEVLDVSAAIFKVTVARLPLPIAVVLKPATMHRISPGETRLHVAVLPAPSAAPPVA